MKTKQLKPLTSAFSVSCWRLNPRNRKQLNCLVGPVAPASRRLLLSPRANAGGTPALLGLRQWNQYFEIEVPRGQYFAKLFSLTRRLQKTIW